MGGGSWACDYAKFSNPPTGASIYYFLKEKPKGELKIEILDPSGKTVRTLSSVPREPDYSSESDDPEDFKKAALPVEVGVQRAVWDLTWEGAREDQERQDRHRRSRRGSAGSSRHVHGAPDC